MYNIIIYRPRNKLTIKFTKLYQVQQRHGGGKCFWHINNFIDTPFLFFYLN